MQTESTTVSSVAKKILDGLENGSVTLGQPTPAPLDGAEVAAFRELASDFTQWYHDSEQLHYCITTKPGGFGEIVARCQNTRTAAFIVAARNISDRLVSEWQRIGPREKDINHRIAMAVQMMSDLDKQRIIAENDLAAANERIAELEFSRAEAEALVMSHEGRLETITTERDQLRAQLDAANARIKELDGDKKIALGIINHACDERDQLRKQLAEQIAVLRRIAERQPKTLQALRDNGFVFADIGSEPGNWQHAAFTIYTDLCEVDQMARDALAAFDEGSK